MTSHTVLDATYCTSHNPHVSVHDTDVCLIVHFPVCRCIRRCDEELIVDALMQGTYPSASIPRNSPFAFSFVSRRNVDRRTPRMMTFTYVPGDGFMLDVSVSATAIAPTQPSVFYFIRFNSENATICLNCSCLLLPTTIHK